MLCFLLCRDVIDFCVSDFAFLCLSLCLSGFMFLGVYMSLWTYFLSGSILLCVYISFVLCLSGLMFVWDRMSGSMFLSISALVSFWVYICTIRVSFVVVLLFGTLL